MDIKSQFYRAFYEPRDGRVVDNTPLIISENLSRVAHQCLNDNEVVRIIYGIGEKLFGNDLDVTMNPDYPEEVKVILQQIQREIPGALPAPDEETAFNYIRSRYLQCGGELEPFIDKLVSDIDSYRESVKTEPAVESASDTSNS